MAEFDSASLRTELRQRRQGLSETQQQLHADQACQHFFDANLLDTNTNKRYKVAAFLSQDGELNTSTLIQRLWRLNSVELYLPALETQPDWHMGFSRYTPDSALINNRFGIPEPDVPRNQHLNGKDMDLVIMPLVGYDLKGHRLGMGGGYYDRTFAFKLKSATAEHSPTLIGWAHSCQQVSQLPSEPWDVPLDGLINETGFIRF
ncbi:5-formyltetrahydrofolate cyclo-ligase [Thiomicrorhabdus sp. zzn3]|uniref:5-formyltetrahydrofolate cyclo-ligase n=1 Tax=Thiomicrorhabdus sp. zzn3 TaxID=3039775 RepID=UPI002436E0C0|nr:5-formyltetrahydrofolate cyclo-ligase [Thiomicrorhabdus sp. zzn3]MDG6777751.1 5-formyltetrahydrofolate cyclo-ligase [Thiomicrorhabdus sp. zzn3]